MPTEMIHVGFGNIVAANRIVAIASPNSAPVKRMVQEGKNSEGVIIDMTNGRRTKAVIVTDSGHILLIAISPETVAGRLLSRRGETAPPMSLEE